MSLQLVKFWAFVYTVILPVTLMNCGGHTPENPKLDGWYSGFITFQEPYRTYEIPLFNVQKQTLSFGSSSTESSTPATIATIPVAWQSEKPYAITLRTHYDFEKEKSGEERIYTGDFADEADGCDRPRSVSVDLGNGGRLNGSLKNGCNFSTWQLIQN